MARPALRIEISYKDQKKLQSLLIGGASRPARLDSVAVGQSSRSGLYDLAGAICQVRPTSEGSVGAG